MEQIWWGKQFFASKNQHGAGDYGGISKTRVCEGKICNLEGNWRKTFRARIRSNYFRVVADTTIFSLAAGNDGLKACMQSFMFRLLCQLLSKSHPLDGPTFMSLTLLSFKPALARASIILGNTDPTCAIASS